MIGEGVHNIYKERAEKGGDILWHVTIKGRKELTPGIPLHMSLKVFEDKKDMDIAELKCKVKEFDIQTPKPEKLKFETTIFTSDRDGKKYYMLLIHKVDKAYSDFYDSLKHCGTVYKKFMPHITIDKELYEAINKDGLKPEEIEFGDLSIESGAGNTVHEFEKHENIDVKILKEAAFYTDIRDSMIIALSDDTFKNWLQDNPEYKGVILAKHEERVRFHFGTSEVAKYAIEHGIDAAYEFLRKNKCS
jgi:hypothetical protein